MLLEDERGAESLLVLLLLPREDKEEEDSLFRRSIQDVGWSGLVWRDAATDGRCSFRGYELLHQRW